MDKRRLAVSALAAVLTVFSATYVLASAITKPGQGFSYDKDDAEWYANYFMVDSLAFDPLHRAEQTAASDVNGDGRPLTLADYMCLIRKLRAAQTRSDNALDCPTGSRRHARAAALSAGIARTLLDIDLRCGDDVGALLLIFNYDCAEITHLETTDRSSGMDIEHRAESGELRVLLSEGDNGARIRKGEGVILKIMATGPVTLDSAGAASSEGRPLHTEAENASYPNPFSPIGMLVFDLCEGGAYEIRIFNERGDSIRILAGTSRPGVLVTEWDGKTDSGVACPSGVYFSQLRVGDRTEVKKFVLLK